MRIAQILYDKAHYVFEAEKMPKWPPYPDGTIPVLVDITDQPEIQEGYSYEKETKAFSPPVQEQEAQGTEEQALQVLAQIKGLPGEARALVLDELAR